MKHNIRTLQPIAALLAFTLACPNSVYAMRQEGPDSKTVRSGLEEALKAGPGATLEYIEYGATRLTQALTPPSPAPLFSGQEEEMTSRTGIHAAKFYLLPLLAEEGSVNTLTYPGGTPLNLRQLHSDADTALTIALIRVFDGLRLRQETGAVVISIDRKTKVAHITQLSAGQEEVETISEPLRQFASNDEVLDIALSPDGQFIASAGLDGTVCLWNVGSGEPAWKYTGHTSKVNAVDFSPDGRYLASAGPDRVIRILDAENGRGVHWLRGHFDEVLDVDFSPNSRTLASTSMFGTIYLWSVESGKKFREIGHHNGVAVNTIDFSPDGRHIVSGNIHGDVDLWSVASGRIAGQFEGHHLDVPVVLFSSDGRYLATGSSDDRTVRLWDAESRQELWQSKAGELFNVAFSPDNQRLVSTSTNGMVHLWDVASGKELRRFKAGTHNIWMFDAVFSPDGRQIITGDSDSMIRVWPSGMHSAGQEEWVDITVPMLQRLHANNLVRVDDRTFRLASKTMDGTWQGADEESGGPLQPLSKVDLLSGQVLLEAGQEEGKVVMRTLRRLQAAYASLGSATDSGSPLPADAQEATRAAYEQVLQDVYRLARPGVDAGTIDQAWNGYKRVAETVRSDTFSGTSTEGLALLTGELKNVAALLQESEDTAGQEEGQGDVVQSNLSAHEAGELLAKALSPTLFHLLRLGRQYRDVQMPDNQPLTYTTPALFASAVFTTLERIKANGRWTVTFPAQGEIAVVTAHEEAVGQEETVAPPEDWDRIGTIRTDSDITNLLAQRGYGLLSPDGDPYQYVSHDKQQVDIAPSLSDSSLGDSFGKPRAEFEGWHVYSSLLSARKAAQRIRHARREQSSGQEEGTVAEALVSESRDQPLPPEKVIEAILGELNESREVGIRFIWDSNFDFGIVDETQPLHDFVHLKFLPRIGPSDPVPYDEIRRVVPVGRYIALLSKAAQSELKATVEVARYSPTTGQLVRFSGDLDHFHFEGVGDTLLRVQLSESVAAAAEEALSERFPGDAVYVRLKEVSRLEVHGFLEEDPRGVLAQQFGRPQLDAATDEAWRFLNHRDDASDAQLKRVTLDFVHRLETPDNIALFQLPRADEAAIRYRIRRFQIKSPFSAVNLDKVILDDKRAVVITPVFNLPSASGQEESQPGVVSEELMGTLAREGWNKVAKQWVALNRDDGLTLMDALIRVNPEGQVILLGKEFWQRNIPDTIDVERARSIASGSIGRQAITSAVAVAPQGVVVLQVDQMGAYDGVTYEALVSERTVPITAEVRRLAGLPPAGQEEEDLIGIIRDDQDINDLLQRGFGLLSPEGAPYEYLSQDIRRIIIFPVVGGSIGTPFGKPRSEVIGWSVYPSLKAALAASQKIAHARWGQSAGQEENMTTRTGTVATVSYLLGFAHDGSLDTLTYPGGRSIRLDSISDDPNRAVPVAVTRVFSALDLDPHRAMVAMNIDESAKTAYIVPEGGQEEASLATALAPFANALAPTHPGVLVLTNSGLEENPSLLGLAAHPAFAQRMAVFATLAAVQRQQLQAAGVQVLDENDFWGLVVTLHGMDEAERVTVLEQAGTLANELRKELPPSVTVHFQPIGATVRAILSAFLPEGELDRFDAEAFGVLAQLLAA